MAKADATRYIATLTGIEPFPDKHPILSLVCKHKDTISGNFCNVFGMCRISGEDRYTVCKKCGKILYEAHTSY